VPSRYVSYENGEHEGLGLLRGKIVRFDDVAPEDPDVVAIEVDYGQPFCAMEWRANVVAPSFTRKKARAAACIC